MQMFDGSSVFTAEVGGRELILETGVLAQQAGGAVTARTDDTVVFASATMSREVREGTDFFPLTVDFEERMYAAGRIPGSFFRREGRPSETAILLCRLTDRPLRPLFPKGFRNPVQIVLSPLGCDGETLMAPLAITAASAALSISDIDFQEPVAAVTIGLIDGDLVVNPTHSQMQESQLNLQVAGTRDNILMVEAGADQVPEDVMLDALRLSHDAMQPLIDVIGDMQRALGKPKYKDYKLFTVPEQVSERVSEIASMGIGGLIAGNPDRAAYDAGIATLKQQVQDSLQEELADEVSEYSKGTVGEAFSGTVKKVVRQRILDQGVRSDGRDTTTVRPISVQVGRIPRVHGSGLFQRGETQVLTVATLGTPSDAQRMDSFYEGEDEKTYMHHYNFPPYSTGEAYMMRGPRRREIGHGALAERAVSGVVPDDFPYTLRLVSECMSSNGSTSMASVCASTLSLMDAGVPISKPVAGVAMGLIQEAGTGRYQVLTDIQGLEDHLGDMDFKVAGTDNGITALQMDIKIEGLDFNILQEALAQARRARLHILDEMLRVIPEPRSDLNEFAPRIRTLEIKQDQIGGLIGPGGKVIRGLQDEFDVRIEVNEEDGKGIVIISGEGAKADNAFAKVSELTEEVELGKEYTGKVSRVADFGLFVDIVGQQTGLIHISQLADYRVGEAGEIGQVGDELTAMVTGITPDGKIRMSRKAVLLDMTLEEAQADDSPGRGGGGRGGRRDDRRDGGGFRDRGSGRDRGFDRDRNFDRGGRGRDRDWDRDRGRDRDRNDRGFRGGFQDGDRYDDGPRGDRDGDYRGGGNNRGGFRGGSYRDDYSRDRDGGRGRGSDRGGSRGRRRTYRRRDN